MQLDDITLPDDLLWINEFDWNPVEQNLERSLTGALLVQEGELKQGRSMELSGGDSAGWVTRDTVVSLQTLAETPNKIMPLVLPDMRLFSVIFDRSSGSPMVANPVLEEAYPAVDSYYYLLLRLIIVP
ncbi:hypothetical protein [Endozoicomonas ascidiicola]|uniref:hypothetical protein n=1 Tax=Endozoicomonas ascidiicola TaxID=1698521 RepID=UPI00082E4E43|nr:hypothetical protein [Endozoicomonas ascidiicola]